MSGNSANGSKEPNVTPLPSADELEADDDLGDISSDASTFIEVIEIEEDVKKEEEISIGQLSRNLPRRQFWKNSYEKFVVTLMYVFAFDTICAFSTLLMKYGFSCLLPIVTLTATVGFPILYLETSLGQFTSTNPFGIFERMSPALAGIGVVATMVNFMILIFAQTDGGLFIGLIIGAHSGGRANREYDNCLMHYNDQLCTPLEDECPLGFIRINAFCVEDKPHLRNYMNVTSIQNLQSAPFHFPMYQYLLRNILGERADMNVDSGLSTIGIGANCLTWLTLLFISVLGTRVIVQICLLTHSCLIGLMITLFILWHWNERPASFSAIWKFDSIKNEAETLLEVAEMWKDCALYVIRSLRIGEGGVIMLGSHNNFHNNILKDTLFLCFTCVVFPFVIAVFFVNFFTNYLARKSTYNVGAFMNSRKHFMSHYSEHYGILYVTSAMSTFDDYQDPLLLFSGITGLLLIMCNVMIRFELITTSIHENFQGCSIIISQMVNRAVILIGFLIMCMAWNRYGLTTIDLLRLFTIPTVTVIIVLCEIALIVFAYGTPRIFCNMNAMMFGNVERHQLSKICFLTKVLHAGVIASLVLVVPTILLAILIILYASPSPHGNIPTPFYVNKWTSLTISILFLTPVPVWMGFRCWQSVKDKNPVRINFLPVRALWGPCHKYNRDLASKMNKEYLLKF